jgi:GDSL-like Lipase/Acylhydrolase family
VPNQNNDESAYDMRPGLSRGSRRVRRWKIAFLAIMAFVPLGAVASKAGAENRVFPILVMGDSYSAGNGGGDYYGAKGCWRSPYNYAGDFARALEQAPYDLPTVLDNVACSGDTTSAFFHRTDGRPLQLDAINKGYGLILLTTGGDDVRFAGIVQNCLIQITRDGQKCQSLLSAADRLLTDGQLEQRIVHVLDAIEQRANVHARIVVLGYPYIEGNEHYLLPYGHDKTIDVPARLTQIGDLGDQVDERAIDRVDAHYHTDRFVFVDTKQLFAGHELFALSLNPSRWFIAPRTDAGVAFRNIWYHPNPTGWAAEARLLLTDRKVPKVNPIPARPPVPYGGDGTIAPDGRIGPLRLRASTLTDVIEFAGQPEQVGDGEASNIEALGYGCSNPSAIAPIAPYVSCDTAFYLSTQTGKLIEFATDSRNYAALGKIRVGTPTGKAERMTHTPAYSGCANSISLHHGRFGFPGGNALTMFITGGRAGRGRVGPQGVGYLPVYGGHISGIVLDGGADVFDCA